jgi:integrase
MRGCVIKRGNKWALVIELARDHVTGKRRRQWYTVEGTKKEAERRLRAELLKVETGAYVKPVNITLGEYLNSWLDEYVETQTRPSTADGYRDIINSHLIPELEGIRLTALEPSHIQTYYTRMVQSGRRDGEGGLSAMTIKHHHAILRKALKCAVESGIVGRNVAEAVKPPRVDQTKQKALAPDDVKRMLDAAKETPIYALLFTALYTGCSPQ